MTRTSTQNDIFQAIADPTRRRILQLLARREMPITLLSQHFSISRPAVTKHLNVLSKAGLVSDCKIGRERRYKVEAEPLREIQQWINHFESLWMDSLSELKDYIEKNN
ncbi:ArsR/SmtB family transcription factor [Metabacillus sp. RGM 3146]|uniref:ArsR/SmtB family transcription factor n=1 Tax=Metabacillus sp. RGM 3146 TaxID=3401092 RepID=UPI003B9C4291